MVELTRQLCGETAELEQQDAENQQDCEDLAKAAPLVPNFAKKLTPEQLRKAHVAYLGDVSGSMSCANRINLLRESMLQCLTVFPPEIDFRGRRPVLTCLCAWNHTNDTRIVADGQAPRFEPFLRSLSAGGENDMKQAIDAVLAKDPSVTDLIVACDGDVTPFDMRTWAEYCKSTLRAPQHRRVHFVAIGNSADFATMEKMADTAGGAFLHRPDKS